MFKKNIPYISEESREFHSDKHLHDVFYPEITNQKKSVLVFIHGGSWYNGNKNIYSKLGINFSEKNVICCVINYRLAPAVNFEKMAEDCAAAVKWITENIAVYNGDPDKIYVCGHSAGGHLAALIALNEI